MKKSYGSGDVTGPVLRPIVNTCHRNVPHCVTIIRSLQYKQMAAAMTVC